MFAKLYRILKPRPMWQIYWVDTLKVVKGKPAIHREHFKSKKKAEKRQKALNKIVVREGTAGIAFDAMLRADAIAARQLLDVKGHTAMRLVKLAELYTEKVTSPNAPTVAIGPEVEAFLNEKENMDEQSTLTVANLKTRIWMWVNLAKISTLGEITRDSVECLRTRGVDAQTKRNDMNAVSNFCRWLVDKRKIDYHPLAGMTRPKPKSKPKPTFSVEECQAVLTAAGKHGRLATLATMIFTGARPSEVEHVRFIYGRHPLVRIQGGKLKGRANRTVDMLPALRAYLAAEGNPVQVPPLVKYHRRLIAADAGVTWKPDVCRHTFISNRMQLAQNDGLVAREGGTSETVIYRHYHELTMPAEARRWARIRPAKKVVPLSPTDGSLAQKLQS